MRELVSNVKVFGLNDTFKANQYSYSADIDNIIPNEKPLIHCAQTPSGSGHDNALMGIIVQFDLCCSNKMWVEAERYHWLDIVMSQSTMHTITKFNLDEMYTEDTAKEVIDVIKVLVRMYNDFDNIWEGFKADGLLDNGRAKFDDGKKYFKNQYREKLRLQILHSNPCGMRLTARMTTNYRQLKTIYEQRKNHALPEWREFCKWIETLPMAKDLICAESSTEKIARLKAEINQLKADLSSYELTHEKYKKALGKVIDALVWFRDERNCGETECAECKYNTFNGCYIADQDEIRKWALEEYEEM